MKKIALLLLVMLAGFSFTAVAQVTIGGHSVSNRAYLGARGFGIGIVSGMINGLSVKNWVSRDHAFQFDATWDLNHGGAALGIAYLLHNFEFIQADSNKFPIYFGFKGWAAFAPGGVAAGIQIPLGIAWIPRDAPIDIFIQAEPGMSFVPAVHFAPGGGIGIRFWLD